MEEEREMGRKGRPTPVLVFAWCAGLFLMLSFATVSSLTREAAEAAALPFPGFSSLARAVGFLVVALLAARIVSLLARPGLLLGSAVAVSLSAVVLFWGAAELPSSVAWAARTVLVAVQNGGFALLYLAWMEFYAQLDLRHSLVCLCLVHLFSALFSFGLFLVGAAGLALLATPLLPLVSLLMLRRADELTRGASYRQGETQRLSWRMSPRPIVLLVAFTLTNAYLRSFLGVEDKAFVLLGVCAAVVPVLLLAVLRFDKLEMRGLYEVAVPVLVAGAMGVLVGIPGGNVAAAFCSNAAFTLFQVFITAVFCAISFRYGVNALWLLGLTQAALTFGSFGGTVLGAVEAALGLPSEATRGLIAVLVVGLVALSMLLVSDRDFETTWGVRATGGDGGIAEATEEERLLRRCAKVARRYGLTRREEEILELMMRGRTLAAIGEELYVAESTMKTHSRHIYRKVGVANRQELQEAVESYPL